jgi:GntR family transcriptional regulator, transcriptional repressor for pyruvate dehydrogenase complex
VAPATQPGNPFESLRRNKVYEEVAGQLQRWIATGLKPGDSLPPERKLVQMFGVSRSSIRDAIHKLQLYGLVETRQGIGTVVRDPFGKDWSAALTSTLGLPSAQLSELLDFRRILEPPLAARAALHATAEEVAEMHQIVARQAAKVAKGQSAVEEDAEFHYGVALAANNTVVLRVLDTVMGLLAPTRSSELQGGDRPARSLAGHRSILSAIERGDAAAAESAMRDHLQDVEAIIGQSLKRTRGSAGVAKSAQGTS